MKSFGYLTLKEAAQQSGKSVEALKKQCQEGRIRGAIKRGKTWFVPSSEIFVLPDQQDDKALRFLLIMGETFSGKVAVTLYVKGKIITGRLLSSKAYYSKLRGLLDKATTYSKQTKESKKGIDKIIDTYFEEVFDLSKTDKSPPHFIHLEEVAILESSQQINHIQEILRLKVSSVDGFSFGKLESNSNS